MLESEEERYFVEGRTVQVQVIREDADFLAQASPMNTELTAV